MPLVQRVLDLEQEYRALSDEALTAKTGEFRSRLAAGETLDDLLPEAFATVREAADRVLGMRPYPVQLVGGVILHQHSPFGKTLYYRIGSGARPIESFLAYTHKLLRRDRLVLPKDKTKSVFAFKYLRNV